MAPCEGLFSGGGGPRASLTTGYKLPSLRLENANAYVASKQFILRLTHMRQAGSLISLSFRLRPITARPVFAL